jgi:type I restriction enzyme R subunit
LILNPIIREEEIKEAVNEILAGSKIANHNRVYGLLDPCLTRYLEATEDEQKEFKSQILNFTNLYSYISQIVDFVDVNLERDFVYSRALASRLPSDGITKVDIGSDLVLTHLKIERAFEGHVDIATPNNPLKPIREVDSGRSDVNSEHLSTIIEELNKRFGLNLTEVDQLLFDQFEQTWLSDPEVTAQAQNNEFENFRLVFDRKFLTTVIGRMDENDLIFKKILDEPAFQQTLMDLYASKIYIRANAT